MPHMLIHTGKLEGKKRREPYKPWVPDHKDTNALEGAVALSCQGET